MRFRISIGKYKNQPNGIKTEPRPQYSVVEAILVENPNFNDLGKLTQLLKSL
ncbi:hypothetical protein MYP_3196 [Sporocytophaga myxococcoides]|uniref:Uncharacterized protein n=1 Tax=Sporocytophaga myxococcoides TaxID=153721 RepID=A0A098LHR7_9BACT|nr:hypothetical protein MYP_3196 [Sporocytophaga myxococcoides]